MPGITGVTIYTFLRHNCSVNQDQFPSNGGRRASSASPSETEPIIVTDQPGCPWEIAARGPDSDVPSGRVSIRQNREMRGNR